MTEKEKRAKGGVRLRTVWFIQLRSSWVKRRQVLFLSVPGMDPAVRTRAVVHSTPRHISPHSTVQHSTAQRSRRNNESTEENITCLSFPDNPILNQQNAWETIFFKNAPTLCAQPTCLISLVCPSVTLRCLSHLSSKLYCTVVMLESEQRKKHVTPTHGLCPAISRVR